MPTPIQINDSQLQQIKTTLFNKIISYLDTNGITINPKDFDSNISISIDEINSQPNTTKKTIKFKPKLKPKSIKFKPTPKQYSYNSFIDICNINNIHYFKYNDTHNWNGPAIKIELQHFDTQIKLFSKFDYTKINGVNFYIIRPSISQDDDSITYKSFETHLISSSTIDYNSDNYDNTTDDEPISFQTEDWEYRNTIYELDPITNYVYTKETLEFIGKKTDDYEIDFDAKES
jgi:hypothetical protein